jgi:hypothetical protein
MNACLIKDIFVLLLIFAFSLQTMAMPGPEEEESVGIGVPTEGDLSTLEVMLGDSVLNKVIFPSLSKQELGRLACTSRKLYKEVNNYRHSLKGQLKHVLSMSASNSQGDLTDVSGKPLPSIGIPFLTERWQHLASHLLPGENQNDWAGLFVTGQHTVVKSVISMRNSQKRNLADAILDALQDNPDVSSFQKAAIQHQFTQYTLHYHNDDQVAKWQQTFIRNHWALPAGDPNIPRTISDFIERHYTLFSEGIWAVDPDQYLVVNRSDLENEGLRYRLNGLFTQDAPQPTLIIDFDREEETAHLTTARVPRHMRHLSITNSGRVENIGPNFLYNCHALTSFQLNAPALATIGHGFLRECPALTSFQLDASALATIGELFLYNCHALTSFQLDVPALTTIGGAFLYNSYHQALTSFHLDAPALTTIDGCFLSIFQALTSFHLDAPALTTIGHGFLSICQALTSFHLDAPALATIGDDFLRDCSALTSFQLDVPALTTIGNGFLYDCHALTNFHLNAPALTTIGKASLWSCPSLTSFYLDAPALATIGQAFLYHRQSSLTSFHLDAPVSKE